MFKALNIPDCLLLIPVMPQRNRDSVTAALYTYKFQYYRLIILIESIQDSVHHTIYTKTQKRNHAAWFSFCVLVYVVYSIVRFIITVL